MSSTPPGREEASVQLPLELVKACVPDSLLRKVMDLFGSPHDRRSIPGCEFLAHFLRLAQIKQLSLLPDQSPQEVAVLSIPGLRGLCTNPSYGWPYCYDTTCKYFSLLQVAGVFFKPKQKRGNGVLYYFPLSTSSCLPVHVAQLAPLHHRRKNMCRSQALQRVCLMGEGDPQEMDAQHPVEETSGVAGSRNASPAPSRPSRDRRARVELRQAPSNGRGERERLTSEEQEMPSELSSTVDRVLEVLQPYGVSIPSDDLPLVKRRLSALLSAYVGDRDAPAQVFQPLQEELAPQEERSRTTSFSSMKDPLPGATSAICVQAKDLTSAETSIAPGKSLASNEKSPMSGKDLASAKKSPMIAKSLPSVKRSTVFTERKDLASTEEPSMVGKGLASTKKSMILEPAKGLVSGKRSRIAGEGRASVPCMLDLSSKPEHPQRAHTHAYARVESTHLSINNYSPEILSENKRCEDEKIHSHQYQTLQHPLEEKKAMMSTIHLPNEETGARAASSLKQTVPEMDQDGAEGSSQKLEADPEPPHATLRARLQDIRRALRELPAEKLTSLALDCSQRFSQSNESAGVYFKRLRAHPELLHLAAVDALVRTWFPDPGRTSGQLNGGWVMTRYRAYAEGGEEPPAEFVAWAHWLMNREFAYSHLERVLETAAQKPSTSCDQWERPLPHEVIVPASTLKAFWAEGGAEGVVRQGYLFVDLDGDMLTPQEYEQHRRRLVPEESNVSSSTQGSDPDVDYEAKTYRAWVASRSGAVEEGETSLGYLPFAVRCWASKLAKWIENGPYGLRGRLDPVSQEYVIEVRERAQPENSWLLEDADQMLRWMRWYRASQAEQRSL